MATVATGVSILELVKKGYQLFNEGNISALMDLYHQDTEWHIMGVPDLPFAGTFKGKDQVMGFFNNWMKPFSLPNLKCRSSSWKETR